MTAPSGAALRIVRYEQAYDDEHHAYEARLVEARSAVARHWLERVRPSRVVEVGGGLSPLFTQVDLPALSRWVLVEPSERFCDVARTQAGEPHRVVQGFFEASEDAVRAALGGPADAVVIDGLLHELPAPQDLLVTARRLLSPSGELHVSVPNADSFHRRLARAMGLITDLRAVSARGERLAQSRVYDLPALREEVESVGFAVTEHGGHTLKPFTHGQMEQLEATLGSAVLDGLTKLGDELPELSAEIYLHARPK